MAFTYSITTSTGVNVSADPVADLSDENRAALAEIAVSVRNQLDALSELESEARREMNERHKADRDELEARQRNEEASLQAILYAQRDAVFTAERKARQLVLNPEAEPED